MSTLTVSKLRSSSEAEIRAAFDQYMAEEKEKGLVDIKFAISSNDSSTVVEAMREILVIEAASQEGLSTPYQDF